MHVTGMVSIRSQREAMYAYLRRDRMERLAVEGVVPMCGGRSRGRAPHADGERTS